MNWVKKHKLPVVEAIQYEGYPCIELEDLWNALHKSFNSTQEREVDIHFLNKIPDKPTAEWNVFSKNKLIDTIKKCNNLSVPGLDKLTWSHIKSIIRNNDCICKFIDIANACIELEHWPSHFKTSTMVVISKPNKTMFDSPKSYQPIILLNTIGKHFEKMIGKCLQFHTISNSFIHPSQLRGLKLRSTMDAGVVLTYIIHSGWVKNLTTSTLAFDIVQFFPFLNHQLLPLILNKIGLNCKISTFFKNYLVGRKTKYLWSEFISPPFNVNVGVGQGSALSPILSVLYLSPVFLSLENHLKILKIPISIIFFVDNGLLISQNKSISHSNANLFCCYNIILSLLTKCGLVVEHRKTDIFHFSRSHRAFNPPPLNLSSLGGPVLLPKETWRYLRFIFNYKLTFRSHIDFYANKVIFTIKCMKLLGNSLRGINLLQKRRLYKCCVLPIALYGFPLWYYNKAPTYYHLNILWKMQRRAALWISGAFQTSSTLGIKAISGLVLIHLHLKKLYRQFLLYESSLPSNHIISNIFSSNGP